MNTIQKIAHQIKARGETQGWKPGSKKADDLNIECWAGAYIALATIDHPDADWVLRVFGLLIATRGYRETLHIAQQTDPV